jgi:hypothetical protein
MPELSLQIVEFAREHGRVTIGDALNLTGAVPENSGLNVKQTLSLAFAKRWLVQQVFTCR